MTEEAAPRRSVMVGVLRIARGRADGVLCFGATPQSFLASLAPLVAFPSVFAGLGLFSDPRRAVTSLALALCVLLTPPVLSFELARFWRRSDRWLRFATALNWCQWTMPMLVCLLLLLLSGGIALGMSEDTASLLFACGLAAYGLWLHWFLARNALGLSWPRAVVLVFLVNSSTVAVVLGPHYLAERLT